MPRRLHCTLIMGHLKHPFFRRTLWVETTGATLAPSLVLLLLLLGAALARLLRLIRFLSPATALALPHQATITNISRTIWMAPWITHRSSRAYVAPHAISQLHLDPEDHGHTGDHQASAIVANRGIRLPVLPNPRRFSIRPQPSHKVQVERHTLLRHP